MYFGKNKHLLSVSIMIAAVIRLASSMIEGIIRMIVNRSTDLTPVMMDAVLWRVQAVCSHSGYSRCSPFPWPEDR